MGVLDEPPFNVVRSWMAVPLGLKDRVLGVLTISWTEPAYFTDDHARLARAFADQAAVAIENARLFEQARSLAAMEERQRLARDLHDSVSQALYGIALGARTARTQLDREPAKAVEPVDYVLSLAEAGLAEMRALIFELRPESLESEGLVAAIRKQAAAQEARHGIAVTCDLCDEPDASPEVREAVYRIVQEALTNTLKHAGAANVRISLGPAAGCLRAEVSDDGVGFDPERDYAGHLGLHSMRERAHNLGGEVRIESSPGSGARVVAEIPAHPRGRPRP
jgi:signal transduction histidine kinase